MNSLLVLAALLSSVVVDVTLSDGQRQSGELLALSNEQITVTLENGEKQAFARTGLQEIRFPKSEADSSPVKARVRLTDQSLIPCEAVVMEDGQIVIDKGRPGEWTAKSKTVETIRWSLPDEETDDQWNEIATKVGAYDLLVIRRQSLDYLKGVVVGIDSEAVKFQYSGDTIPAPLAKVAGIMLAKQAAEQPTVRIRLTTHDGGLWMLDSASLDKNQVSVITASGVKARLPLESIASIAYPQLGAVYLTDLEPTDVRLDSLVASTVLAESLKKLNGPKFDVGYDGQPLRIVSSQSQNGSQSFQRGLAVQSRTELVYRLAGKYQRFTATAGIAIDSASQADVELVVFADEREAFRKAIKSEDEPVAVDVDVSSARRLKLVVDYGANLDVGDRLHLGDARLVK